MGFESPTSEDYLYAETATQKRQIEFLLKKVKELETEIKAIKKEIAK
jgi:hypothetical protein